MHKGSIYILGFMTGVLVLVSIVYFIMQYDYHKQVNSNQNQSSPVVPSISTDMQNSNPNYYNLTEEEIGIADQAIGHLLNNSSGITPPMITVQQVIPQDFSDASLGCPQPDQVSAQVITPGYQVILMANGTEYDYRITGEQVMLCE